MTFEHRTAEPDGSFSEQRTWTPMPPSAQSWYLLHQQLDGVVIPRPGTIRVMLRTNDETTEACVGTLTCVLVNPSLLTPDRIAAIRAQPTASKYARVTLSCKHCPAKLIVNTGIEKPPDLDGQERIWYEDAPAEWKCSCGATVFDLSSIRQNLHAILGTTVGRGEVESEASFIGIYTKSSLKDVCAELGALLDDDPLEKDIQLFLGRHTIFLHRFSAMRIIPKAPILTKYCTDFAILDSRGVLVLVELERPGIKLLKKVGDISQNLQHAFDQVRRWMQTMQRRWTAALECMNLREDDVAGIRGVVVAGRDHPYPSEHLMRLKGGDHGQIEFYTYDDLLEDAINLIREFD